MDNLEYIETFFSGDADARETSEFEARLLSDPAFAEEVAFYLSTRQIAIEETEREIKERHRIIYQENQLVNSRTGKMNEDSPDVMLTRRPAPIRRLVTYLSAAAAAAAIIFGVYTFSRQGSPQEMATLYEKEHLQILGVTMSARDDSIQNGIRLYNDGKIAEALSYFENMAQSDTANFTAKRYAGLSALRQKNFDKAMSWFEQLETYHGLYANPALLYQAITLMERNQHGDPEKAKQKLQWIVDKDLEGKEIAQTWLRKW